MWQHLTLIEYQSGKQSQIKKLDDELTKQWEKYSDFENMFDDVLLEKDEEISCIKIIVKNYLHKSRSKKNTKQFNHKSKQENQDLENKLSEKMKKVVILI